MHILTIPFSCQFKIFEYFDLNHLRKVRLVSKHWKMLADCDRTWKIKALKEFNEDLIPLIKPSKGWKKFFFSQGLSFLNNFF